MLLGLLSPVGPATPEPPRFSERPIIVVLEIDRDGGPVVTAAITPGAKQLEEFHFQRGPRWQPRGRVLANPVDGVLTFQTFTRDSSKRPTLTRHAERPGGTPRSIMNMDQAAGVEGSWPSLDWLPDGRRLVIHSNGIRTWNPHSGQYRTLLSAARLRSMGDGQVDGVAWLGSEQTAVFGWRGDGRERLYRLRGGEAQAVGDGVRPRVSSDGRQLITRRSTSAQAGEILLYDLRRLSAAPRVVHREALAACFAPDGVGLLVLDTRLRLIVTQSQGRDSRVITERETLLRLIAGRVGVRQPTVVHRADLDW